MTNHIPSKVNTIFILSSTVLVAIAANANILLAIVLAMVLLVALHASSSNFKVGNKTRQLLAKATKNIAQNAAQNAAQTAATTVEGFSSRPAAAYAEPVKILKDESSETSSNNIAPSKLASDRTTVSLSDSVSTIYDPHTGEIPEIESYAMKDSSLISNIQYQPFVPEDAHQLPPATQKQKRESFAVRRPELLEIGGLDESEKLYAGISIAEDESCYTSCSRQQTAQFTDSE